MAASNSPLIAGAGPVGLAAALFLARDGVEVRIVDAAIRPSPESRALAVNPRTLEILEPTGVADEMLAIGKIIHGAHLWHNGKLVGEIAFKDLQHKFPYMLALSQGTTVRLLEAKLKRHGVAVEWGLQLNHCQNVQEHVEAELKATPGGQTEVVNCPWMLAADGARSTARHELGIEFQGTSLESEWHLLDLPLETSLEEEFAHVIVLDGGGFIFLLRVVDETEKSRTGPPIWRMIGNASDLLSRLDSAKPAGPAVWQSSFHIAHRINSRMQDGNVFFAGDAAHVHSPMGARGMNLGIEDAWVFSELCRENRMSSYGEIRHKVDRRVVRKIELLTRMVMGESTIARMLRATFLPVVTHTPIVRDRMIFTMTGLDHPLSSQVIRREISATAS